MKIPKKELKTLSRIDRSADLRKVDKIDNLMRQVHVGMGYDPLQTLVSIAKKNSTDDAMKIKIAFGLMDYMYPKLRAQQVDPNQGEVINVSVVYPDMEKSKDFKNSLALPSPVNDTVTVNLEE